MNRKFLEVLRCPEPDCNGSIEILQEEETYNGHIEKGKLLCNVCNAEYRIMDGFPILLPEEMDDESQLQDIDKEELRRVR